MSGCGENNRKAGRCEKFWLEDLTHLVVDGKFAKIFPHSGMTQAEQLNAISRIAIYSLLILIVLDNNRWLAIPVAILLITVVLHKINEPGPNKLYVDTESLQYLNPKDAVPILGETQETDTVSVDPLAPPVFRSQHMEAFESVTPTAAPTVGCKMETCVTPSLQNPFMNPNFTDFNSGPVPAACNADDEEIQDAIHVNFNHDLFRDVDELWERENSQRQFYTIPNTAIPNNQVEFAKWLYGSGSQSNCKTDGTKCLRYEDLRWKRNNYKR